MAEGGISSNRPSASYCSAGGTGTSSSSGGVGGGGGGSFGCVSPSDYTVQMQELESGLIKLQVAVSLDPEEESPMDLIGVYEEMGDIYYKMESLYEEQQIHYPYATLPPPPPPPPPLHSHPAPPANTASDGIGKSLLCEEESSSSHRQSHQIKSASFSSSTESSSSTRPSCSNPLQTGQSTHPTSTFQSTSSTSAGVGGDDNGGGGRCERGEDDKSISYNNNHNSASSSSSKQHQTQSLPPRPSHPHSDLTSSFYSSSSSNQPSNFSSQMYQKALDLSNKAFTRQTCLNWQRINVRINCKLARNYQLLSSSSPNSSPNSYPCSPLSAEPVVPPSSGTSSAGYERTLVYLEQAICICEKTSHHFLESKLPSLYYCYAHVHLLNNDIHNGWLFYNVAYELASKVDKHLAILSMYELGKILTRVKAESRAQKYFEECLKMSLNYLGTIHVLTGMIYEALGIQLRKQNDLTNTMILLEKARDIFRIVLGHNHYFTLRVNKQLSDAVNKRKKSTIYID